MKEFRGRGILICYQFLQIVDLIFSVTKGYIEKKITNFYKVWWEILGGDKSESVISFSKLLT